MAFDDTPPATPARSRYSGEGFRQEPDFREGTATFQAVPSSPPASDAEPTVTIAKRAAPPNLTYVFDDPADGEPGRDRMLVHGLWELFLAVALGVMAYLLYREQTNVFSGAGLRQLLLQVTVVGVLAAGAGIALRAGAVNLAVGPVGIAAALFFAQNSDGGLLQPLLVVVGLCAAVGAVQGLMMVGLHVPPWAASAVAAVGVFVWSQQQQAVRSTGLYSAEPHLYWWFGGFCAISIVFSIFGAVPGVRRAFGRFRPVSDPADRRGWAGAVIVLAATVASSVLAGVAGVLSASVTGAAAPSEGLVLSAVGIGIALVGGTSAFGRRGGIFGTVLAAGLFAVVAAYSALSGLNWPTAALAAGVLGLGLIVTRMVETYGRPELDEPDADEAAEDWLLNGHSATESVGPTSWPAGKPYQASTAQPSAGGLWSSDDAWGTAERR